MNIPDRVAALAVVFAALAWFFGLVHEVLYAAILLLFAIGLAFEHLFLLARQPRKEGDE